MRPSKHFLNDDAGYTLTEMLVVILIITLIAAVVTPTILSQLSRAKAKTASLQLDSTAADKMVGKDGDDTYHFDALGDKAVEAGADGTDSVIASVSVALSANIENLTLTGSDDLSGTGNDEKNASTGNGGSNTLDGGKGVDQDISVTVK